MRVEDDQPNLPELPAAGRNRREREAVVAADHDQEGRRQERGSDLLFDLGVHLQHVGRARQQVSEVRDGGTAEVE